MTALLHWLSVWAASCLALICGWSLIGYWNGPEEKRARLDLDSEN